MDLKTLKMSLKGEPDIKRMELRSNTIDHDNDYCSNPNGNTRTFIYSRNVMNKLMPF